MIPHQLPLLADLHFGDERLPTRFWSKVTIDESGCWLWTAAITSRGYGSWGRNGKVYSTHRVIYETLRGPIAAGLTIDHLCETKRCCNPAHLEAVTQGENNRRRSPFAPAFGAHVCLRGHPLAGTNLKVRSNGQRRCILCRREHSRAYRRRQAARAAS